MRFTPKTERQIAADNLLHPGIYGFEIVEAEDTTSKAGNEMIHLTVHVFSDDGTPSTLHDYLMEQVAYKLRHAAEVCGLIGDYEKGALDALDFQGKTGRCKVVIQKDKTGNFPDKNSITDYVLPVAGADVSPPRRTASRKVPARDRVPAGDLDDEIPF